MDSKQQINYNEIRKELPHVHALALILNNIACGTVGRLDLSNGMTERDGDLIEEAGKFRNLSRRLSEAAHEVSHIIMEEAK